MESNLQRDPLMKGLESDTLRRRLIQSALVIAAGGGMLRPAGTVSASEGRSPSHPGRPGQSMMRDAIKACMDCHSTCLQTAMNLCLERGGRHVEQEHFRLMLNCAELCQTSANFMLSDSPMHGRVCAVCADVCDACAKSCQEVGGMSDCVDECLRCAKSCRSMEAMS